LVEDDMDIDEPAEAEIGAAELDEGEYREDACEGEDADEGEDELAFTMMEENLLKMIVPNCDLVTDRRSGAIEIRFHDRPEGQETVEDRWSLPKQLIGTCR
jgi:hypothetical protein